MRQIRQVLPLKHASCTTAHVPINPWAKPASLSRPRSHIAATYLQGRAAT